MKSANRSPPKITQAPDWFISAISAPYRDHTIESSGTNIHYQSWGDNKPGKPGLIFIHGHGGNAHWWDFIAPSFTDTHRVVAMDVSGAGDSGHRQEYTNSAFVQEVMDVRDDAGFDADCILVGHSFGGRIARYTGRLHSSAFAGIVLADSAMYPVAGRSSRRKFSTLDRPMRCYPSRDEAARRFRLRPPQPCTNRYILDYIAQHSVGHVADGWRWKLDQKVFAKMPDLYETEDAATMIRSFTCRTGVIYGEGSRFFTADSLSYMRQFIAADAITCITDAHHHVFVDQPLAFIKALTSLLNSWG